MSSDCINWLAGPFGASKRLPSYTLHMGAHDSTKLLKLMPSVSKYGAETAEERIRAVYSRHERVHPLQSF